MTGLSVSGLAFGLGRKGGRDETYAVVIVHVPGKTPVKKEQVLSEQGSPGDAYTLDLIVD